jgi:hypothetical protein
MSSLGPITDWSIPDCGLSAHLSEHDTHLTDRTVAGKLSVMHDGCQFKKTGK